MATSILEKLQQDVNPTVPFADVKQNFSNPDNLVEDLKPTISKPEIPEITSFDLSSIDNITTNVPASSSSLETSISGRIDNLNSINFDTLTAVIPSSPSADNFKDITVTNDIQNNITNLTNALIGNVSIEGVSQPQETTAGAEDIIGEFNQFITNAGMLPVKTLDALIKVFKKLLDQLSDPEKLLQQLGSEALTNIFQEQIQSLKDQLPEQSIKIIADNIDQRQEEITKYNKKVNQLKELMNEIDKNKILTPEEITRIKNQIKDLRQDVKEISNNLERLDQSTVESLDNLRNFKVSDFQSKLESIAQNGENEIILKPLFDQINQYINKISDQIENITKNLREFTQKIPRLIDEGIEKVESIATTITQTISDKIEQGKDVLDKLTTDLDKIIKEIEEFIDETINNTSNLIKPFKQASNDASDTVVTQIDKITKDIKETTDNLTTSIEEVNTDIKEKLNREQLEKKISDFLDEVTKVLQDEAVQNALSSAENGINTITENLKNVTLQPAFDTVVIRSSSLETQLKEVDISKLSTPSKAALKVGTEVIKQVDIPGTVKPELQTAFQEILDPLENIIVLIEREFQNINSKIESFAPGTLVNNFLTPYLTPVITKLEDYKPSKILKPIEDFYKTFSEKIELINPKQLLEKLEDFYKKLVDVVESLSPEKITKSIEEKLDTVKKQLDQLPVEKLVEKVKDGLGSVDKLMASLGLGDVLKSDFWENLQEILSFNFEDKITEIEKIRDKLSDKIGAIDDNILKQELEGLKQAIATYVNNPNNATNISLVTTANANYQTTANTLLNPSETLKDITVPAEVMIDYRDLKTRLENLYNNFTANKPELPEQTVNKIRTIVRDKVSDLKGNETSRNALLTTSDTVLTFELVTNFKKVIPDEIDRQITNPITEILEKLDTILEQPRTILDDIKKVIYKIAEAPGKIANILSEKTQELGNNIRKAINSLKEAITDITTQVVDTLEDTHKIIIETVKKLNPRRLLHVFDESDFKQLDKLINMIKFPETDDVNPLVSQYINEHLSPETKTLMVNGSSEKFKQALIEDLNELLLDPNFYNEQRFPNINTTKVIESITKNNKIDEEEKTILLNRLLLETHYNKTAEDRIIVMNIESIFPYLKEKLKEIYPQEVVNKLDESHQAIIQLLKDIPEAIGNALNQKYQEKIVTKTEELRQKIDDLFRELRVKLEQLKSELDLGLEDIGDSFDRLINAIPV